MANIHKNLANELAQQALGAYFSRSTPPPPRKNRANLTAFSEIYLFRNKIPQKRFCHNGRNMAVRFSIREQLWLNPRMEKCRSSL